jgi:hypothetical protein
MSQPQGARIPARRIDPPYGQKAMSHLTMFPDRLLDNLALHDHVQMSVSDGPDAVLVHPIFFRKNANDIEISSRIRDVRVRNNRHRLSGLEFVRIHSSAGLSSLGRDAGIDSAEGCKERKTRSD